MRWRQSTNFGLIEPLSLKMNPSLNPFVSGVPAVIVSLVAIIDTDTYGRVPLDLSNSNSTAMYGSSRNKICKHVESRLIINLYLLVFFVCIGGFGI